MKILKQLLFIAIITVCASFAAMAQDKEGRKVPPKDDARPKVIVKDKDEKGDKPKEDKPRNDDRRNDNRGRKPE